MRFGVGFAVFPHSEHDADPLEGECSQGGMMLDSSGSSIFVPCFCPGAPFAGVVCEFVEGLPQEFRTRIAAFDDSAVAALLSDRGDATVALELFR